MRIFRILSVILAVSAALLMCSCGNEKNDDPKNTASATAEAVSSKENGGENKTYGIVTLSEFSGITVEDEIISDDEVTSKIMQMLSSYPGIETDSSVDTAELYDMANFDYTGFIDGKEFEGGTDTGAELTLGSNRFIPGFEDQMVGMKVGETKDITVTFPADYHAAEYAGKEAVFRIKLNSLKRFYINEKNIKILSGLDDMTVEAYREYIKEELRINMIVNEHFEEYVNSCSFKELDSDKLDEYIENKRMADEYYASYYGKTVAEYTGYSGKAYETFLTDYATKMYKQESVIAAIKSIYNLTLSDRERTLAIHRYSAELSIDAETFIASYSADTLTNGLMNDAAMKYAASRFTIK